MRRWLRRQAANYIGITRYLLAAEHARAERDEAVRLRDEADARTVAAVHLAAAAFRASEVAYRHADGARALMWSMVEPEGVDGCVKVRLRSRSEAEAFAARVLAETGEECRPYRCQLCPRQPVSTERFWHISTVNPRRKGARGGPHRHPKLLLRLFGEAS